MFRNLLITLVIIPIMISVAEGKERFFYYSDTADIVSFSEIKKLYIANKTIPAQSAISLGFVTTHAWIVVESDSIKNNNDQFVIFENAHLDKIEFYCLQNNKLIYQSVSGDHLKFSTRYLQINFINFRIPAGTDKIFIKVHTQGPFICPVKIFNFAEFTSYITYQNFILGGYFFLLGIVAVINFILYSWVMEKVYLYYSLFLLGNLILTVTDLGFGFQYFWPDKPDLNNTLVLFLYLSVYVSLLFTDKLLDLKISAKFFHEIFSSVYWLLPVFTLLILVADYRFNIKVQVYFGLLVPMLCFVASAIVFFRFKEIYYRFFIAGWLINILGILLYVIIIPVALPTSSTFNLLFQITSIIQISFFNLSIFSRIEVQKKEKELLLKNQNLMLEERVTDRTSELELSKKLIKQQNENLVNQQEVLQSQNVVITEQNMLLQNRQKQLESIVSERTQDLRNRESSFRFLIQALPAFICVLIPESPFRVEYVNGKFLQYTGLTQETTDLKNLQSLLLPHDIIHVMSDIKTGLSVNNSFKLSVRIKNVENITYRWHLVSFHPHQNEDGKVIRWYIFAVDIHDEKSARENLEKLNRQLRLINFDLDDFIYTASHEMRVPLANIQGLIADIESNSDIYIKPETDFSVILDLIKASLEKLQTTINYLAEISVYQKEEEKEQQVIYFPDVIDEAAGSLSKIISESNVELVVKVSECPVILFSKINAVRILSILLSNAIVYRDPQRNPVVIIECRIDGAYLLLSVTDNGIGIGEEQFDKIFKIFKRVETRIQGVGIGLYIARRIIENSNGKITVDSKPGVGSTFTVYFPYNPVAA